MNKQTFFKVTMAYSDTSSSTSSQNVLINDVGLTVKIGSTTYYPNELYFYYSIINRLNEPDHYNNVEVISLSKSTLQKVCPSSGNCEATVEIKRYSLSTKYQPVSVVITGEFVFDSVIVNDDTSNNYSDIPAKIKDVDLIMKIIFVVVVVLIIAFIMYSLFVLIYM